MLSSKTSHSSAKLNAAQVLCADAIDNIRTVLFADSVVQSAFYARGKVQFRDTCHAGHAAEGLDRRVMVNARADGAGLLTIATSDVQ